MVQHDFKTRLKDEQRRLEDKIFKLNLFMITTEFKALPQIDQDDLFEQHKHMTRYLVVLTRRIDRFL